MPKQKDEVNDAEYVAFLLYWLCHHIVCYRLKKLIKAYLGLAITLHRKEEVAIRLLMLSHMNKGMHDLVILEKDEPLRIARGPT